MSKSSFKPRDKATANLTARPNAADNFKIGGIYTVTCIDADGNLKWVEEAHNLFTTAGIDHIMDIVFGTTAKDATLYVGLIDEGTPMAAADTLASPTNWTEATETATGSANRQEWVNDAGGSSSGALGNGDSVASFTIDDTDTIGGAFLTNVETGTAGILYCVVEFTDRAVASGDTLTVDYTITAADS